MFRKKDDLCIGVVFFLCYRYFVDNLEYLDMWKKNCRGNKIFMFVRVI